VTGFYRVAIANALVSQRKRTPYRSIAPSKTRGHVISVVTTVFAEQIKAIDFCALLQVNSS